MPRKYVPEASKHTRSFEVKPTGWGVEVERRILILQAIYAAGGSIDDAPWVKGQRADYDDDDTTDRRAAA